MKRDAAYFSSLAQLSEVVLLTAVTELARRQDLQSLHGFMDFVRDLPDPTSFPVLSGNKTISFPTALQKGDTPWNDGLNVATGHSFASSMVLALTAKPYRATEASLIPTQEAHPFDNTQQDYLKRLLEMAQVFPPESQWPSAVGVAIAKNLNAAGASDMLKTAGVSFDVPIGFSSKTKHPQTTLVDVAFAHGNLAFAAQALQGDADADMVKSLKLDDSNDMFRGTFSKQMAAGLESHPAEVLHLIEALGKKMSRSESAVMRARLLDEQLQVVKDKQDLAKTTTVQTLIGATPQDCEAFKVLCKSDHVVAQSLASEIVRTHTHEILPMLKNHFLPFFGEGEGADYRVCGFRAALNRYARVVTTPTEQDALRATLLQLVQYGQNLAQADYVDKTFNALHFLAEKGEPIDRMAKMHVLLNLGVDPLKKNAKGQIPGDLLDPDERLDWDHTVHAFSARKIALSLLSDLTNEDASIKSPLSTSRTNKP